MSTRRCLGNGVPTLPARARHHRIRTDRICRRTFSDRLFPHQQNHQQQSIFFIFHQHPACFSGLVIFFFKTKRSGTLSAARIFLAGFVFIHLYRLDLQPCSSGNWTTFAEILAYWGGAYLLMSVLSDKTKAKPASATVIAR